MRFGSMVFLGVCLCSSVIAQDAQQEERRSDLFVLREPNLAYERNVGFGFGIAPGVYFPSDGGSAQFLLSASVHYGIGLTDWLVLMPGVSTSFYFGDPGANLTLARSRLLFALDWFAPFVEAGAGPAFFWGDFAPDAGLALHAGTGFYIYPSERFSLGVALTYDTVVDRGFKVWGISPMIGLAI